MSKTFTRLDAIRAAWVDAEVEPIFITAQADMAYLLEQYEGEKTRAKFLQRVVDEAETTERSLREQFEAQERHIIQALEWLETEVKENGETYLITEAIGSMNHALYSTSNPVSESGYWRYGEGRLLPDEQSPAKERQS